MNPAARPAGETPFPPLNYCAIRLILIKVAA